TIPEGTCGTVWAVVGFSYRQATTYQSLEMPAGHRPIELEAETIVSRFGACAGRMAGGGARANATATASIANRMQAWRR
ncbi:MAG: hypothetical protein ACREC6_11030, partial [Hyphomicrobiaceae bacterium]